MSYATALRNKARELAHAARRALPRRRRERLKLRPWAPVRPQDLPASGAWCVLCGWTGEQFPGAPHSEAAQCPRCLAVGRDRFLYLCLYQRVRRRRRLRVLETSPRLGEDYRRAMARRVRYLASDYDERAHKTAVKLDLTRMDLPDASLDLVLTAHVLEHVPDTDAALRELYRVLRPGGRALVQVPLGQAVTAPPPAPEFHEDNTPVFWRFGLDFTGRLRQEGFAATLLVTGDFRRRVLEQDADWPEGISAEWDAVAMVRAADPADLTVVADDAVAERSWLRPSYMHAVWECVKPRAARGRARARGRRSG
jgi:SAM-dependent methyltransferase